ncbi:MAG TPA: hypothetical protein VMB46_08880 [Methanomassiliicoccales archaeon]|nr:hypothetical protein [Methanomassiliicoccales archaeon]
MDVKEEIACHCESDGTTILYVILAASVVAGIALALIGAYVVILAIVFFDMIIGAHNLTIYRERHKAD